MDIYRNEVRLFPTLAETQGCVILHNKLNAICVIHPYLIRLCKYKPLRYMYRIAVIFIY